MNKRNYQKELEKLIDQAQKDNKIPSLFLHSCCAPCSSYVLEYLSKYFNITVFYYNPNIYPEEEYRKRVHEITRLVNSMESEHPVKLIEGHYDPQEFFRMAKGLEDVPEGGERCFKCYRLRMEEAAKLVSVLPVTEIKIHSLYIIKGTKLAKMYEKGDIKLLPPEEYAERVVLILSMLRPDIVVQRIVGRASANTLSVNGGRPWWEVKEYIEKLMRNRHIQQGSACNYLHGAAVRRFLHE